MVVGNQLLMHDQLKVELKDDHLKRTIELSGHEGMSDGMLEKKLVNPTKVSTRLQEFMMYMQYRLKQSMDWSMDLEVEA